MPFNDWWRAWSRQEIESLDPDQNGVYGIFRDDTAVYIGSGDIRARLLAHFGSNDPCITRERPNRWTALTIQGDPTGSEGSLAREYHPTCGERHPRV